MQTQGSRASGSRAASHLLCHPIFEMSHRSDCDQQVVSIGGTEVMVLGMRPNLHAEKLLANVCSVCLMLRPVHKVCAWHPTAYMQLIS